MSRNDSVLYSGSTSASFAKEKLDVKKQEKVERDQKRLVLKPYAEIVLDEIDKLIGEISHIKYADIETRMTDETFKNTMFRNQGGYTALTTLKRRLNKVLRDNKQ